MEYKGYHAKYEVDEESNMLVGKILGISDLVTFESEDVAGLKEEFESAVDDYLEFCREVGKEPDKEYKGSFNIRITPEMHRKAAIAAECRGISLNQFVLEAIDNVLNGESTKQVIVVQQNETKTLKAFSDDDYCLKESHYSKSLDRKVSYIGGARYGS